MIITNMFKIKQLERKYKEIVHKDKEYRRKFKNDNFYKVDVILGDSKLRY